jgi:hypothetical protein
MRKSRRLDTARRADFGVDPRHRTDVKNDLRRPCITDIGESGAFFMHERVVAPDRSRLRSDHVRVLPDEPCRSRHAPAAKATPVPDAPSFPRCSGSRKRNACATNQRERLVVVEFSEIRFFLIRPEREPSFRSAARRDRHPGSACRGSISSGIEADRRADDHPITVQGS